VRGVNTGEPVVQWKADGSETKPGPKAAHYESVRKTVGAHLLYNAFWLVNHFCVHSGPGRGTEICNHFQSEDRSKANFRHRFMGFRAIVIKKMILN